MKRAGGPDSKELHEQVAALRTTDTEPREGGAVTRKPPTQAVTTLTGPPSVASGETFEVVLRLAADGGVRSLPLQLAYDPLKLQVLEVREGPYFKRGGGDTAFVQQVAPQDGRVAVSIRRAGNDGVQGDAVVATFKFRALGSGKTRVALVAATAFGVDGADPTTVLAAPVEVEVK